jgi:hypothetical protein
MGDLWTYRDYEWGSSSTDIAGYEVQALDGQIGNIDEATYEVGASFVVVDVGPWIIGKKVLLPAGLIERVDLAAACVYINRTKEQIRDAPPFNDDRYRDPDYRLELEAHYGEGGPGYWAHDSDLADPTLRP